MMTSSQEPQFLVNFLDFSKNFSKIFLKIYKIWTKIFNFSRKFLLKLMLSLCGVWDLLTKLHRSSWMSDVLPITPRPFLKSWGFLHRREAGPWPKNPIPKVNLLSGKFSRAHCSCLCLACRKLNLIDETPFPNLVFSMLPPTQSW